MTASAVHRIRRAEPADVDLIMDLLDEAIRWLAGRGTDQWQRKRRRQRKHVETDLAEGTVFVVERDGRVVATITLDEFADADFWRGDDDPRAALYVHRMAVARDAAGIGLGSAMLDWAAGQVERRGRAWLRLDAWRTNGALHVYYKQLGFEHVRTETVEVRGSGALFAREAAARHGGGPKLIDLVTPRCLSISRTPRTSSIGTGPSLPCTNLRACSSTPSRSRRPASSSRSPRATSPRPSPRSAPDCGR